MATNTDKLVSEIRLFSNEEKIQALEALLTDPLEPDLDIDAVWAADVSRLKLMFSN